MRQAENAGRLSRRPETGYDDAHLAEFDQHGRRAGDGVEQVERGLGTEAQCDAAIYADVSGSNGLHAGCDAERDPDDLRGDSWTTDGAGNTVPATGDVCGF